MVGIGYGRMNGIDVSKGCELAGGTAQRVTTMRTRLDQ